MFTIVRNFTTLSVDILSNQFTNLFAIDSNVIKYNEQNLNLMDSLIGIAAELP